MTDGKHSFEIEARGGAIIPEMRKVELGKYKGLFLEWLLHTELLKYSSAL